MTRCERIRRADGNTLVLFPAAVLVLFALAAIALDSAALFAGQRRLQDLAATVATGAATLVDERAFYTGASDRPLVDRERGARLRDVIVASQRDDALLAAARCDLLAPTADDLATGRVRVHCTGTVTPVLAAMWPGAPRQRTVEARDAATAVLRR